MRHHLGGEHVHVASAEFVREHAEVQQGHEDVEADEFAYALDFLNGDAISEVRVAATLQGVRCRLCSPPRAIIIRQSHAREPLGLELFASIY
jgi:hypothetical protein